MTFEFFKNFYKRTRATKKKRSVIAQRNIIILITSWNAFMITIILVPLLISHFSSENIRKQNAQFKISNNKNTKFSTFKSNKPYQNTRISSLKPNMPSKLTTKPKLSTLLSSIYTKRTTTTTEQELPITTIKPAYNRISVIQLEAVHHKIAPFGEYLAIAIENKLKVIDKNGRLISEKNIIMNSSIASLGPVSSQDLLVGFSNGFIGLYHKKEYRFIKTGCHETVSMIASTDERNLFLYAAGKLICSVNTDNQEVNRVIGSCSTKIEALHMRENYIITAHKDFIQLRLKNGLLRHSFATDNQITSFAEMSGVIYSNSLNKNAILQWSIESSQIVSSTEIIKSERSMYHLVKMSSRFLTCGEKVFSWKRAGNNKWLPDEIDEKIGLVRSLAVLSFQVIAGSTDDGKIIFWKAKF